MHMHLFIVTGFICKIQPLTRCLDLTSHTPHVSGEWGTEQGLVEAGVCRSHRQEHVAI